MKALKIIAGILFGLVALLLVAILVLVLVIDPNDYKPEIEKLAANKGIELKFEGDLGWSFYPGLGVKSGKISVKPPMKNLAEPMRFGGFALSVKIKPLFSKKIEVKQIRILDGEISLKDETTGELTQVSDIDLLVNEFNMQQQPFTVEISLDMKKSRDGKVSQAINLDTLMTVTTDKNFQQVIISDSKHTIGFTGDAVHGKQVAIVADFAADIDLVAKKALLKPLKFSVDKTQFNGSVESHFGDKPWLGVELAGDSMNADYYLETPPATKDNDVRSSGDKEPQLIPAETIRALPGRYAIKFKQLTLNHLKANNFDLLVNIADNGLLTIDNFQADAYDGHFKLTGSVDARSAQPMVKLDFNMTPLQLEPALKDYLQLDHSFASGDFAFDAKVSTQGLTRGQLMQALDGQFTFSSKNVTLNQVSLTNSLDASLLQLVQMKLPALSKDAEKTQMENTKGEGVITDGLVNNTSLAATSLCTGFNGKGTFNLVSSAIDYRMGVSFPSTDTRETCQSINTRLKDIDWPVHCKGTLEDEPAKLCTVDKNEINGILTRMAKKEAGKKVEGAVDKQLEKKFGKDAEAVKETLKGLFR